MGVSQTHIPLFTDSTATTTGTTVEPPVTINASDVGVGASGFTVGYSTIPISPLNEDDPDIVYDGDDKDFRGLTYSPFNIRTESDDEAPVTKGKLKAINENLDSLLQSTKASTGDN